MEKNYYEQLGISRDASPVRRISPLSKRVQSSPNSEPHFAQLLGLLPGLCPNGMP